MRLRLALVALALVADSLIACAPTIERGRLAVELPGLGVFPLLEVRAGRWGCRAAVFAGWRQHGEVQWYAAAGPGWYEWGNDWYLRGTHQ